jgi:hypothetical protein
VTIKDRAEFLDLIRKTGEKYGVTIVCLNRNMIAGFEHVKPPWFMLSAPGEKTG